MAILPATGPGGRFPTAPYNPLRDPVWPYGAIYLDLTGPGDELLLTTIADKLILEGDEAPITVVQFRPGGVPYAGAQPPA